MPNWCESKLHVTGPESDLRRFQALVEASRELNDVACVHLLAAIIPMPAELKGICMGSKEIGGTRYERWYEETAGSPARGITKHEKQELREKYDAEDWYEWRTKNWGNGYATDWETQMIVTPHDGLWFKFDTEEAPPLTMLAEIAAQWWTLEFEVDYWSENKHYGSYTFRLGKIVGETRGGDKTLHQEGSFAMDPDQLDQDIDDGRR